MKLTKLHLYGFGRFQDTQIELSKEPIHLFLGNNEAGKSTLMAFIRCVLFGFPTKQQSELRYEPKLGGRYGGNIVIETKEYGTVTVERVHGKATGNAKVYFSNGNIGGEGELKLILSEIDRTTFSGIYSFGLTDLQTIEQLHADELNKFMYGVGISGRNNLLEIEKRNEKLMQVLYKPTGRKPIINDQLKKVVDLEEKVSSWRRKLSQHENLVKQQTAIVELIEKASRDELALDRDYRYFDKLQSLAPVFLNKMIYESRLEQLPPYQPYPEDGLQRLEKFNDSSVVCEGELIAIEKKLDDIYSEKAKLRVNENVTELEEAISQVKESRKIYETKRDEKALLLHQIEFEQQEFEVIKEKLGDNAAPFETSFVAQQKLTNLIKKEVEIKQQGFFLQSQFEQVKTSLEDKENQVETIKRQLLDDKTKKQLEETLAKQDTEKELQQQLKYVDEGLQMVNRQLDQFVSRKTSFKTLLLLAVLLLSLFCAFILVKNSQMVLAASVVIGTFIVLGYTKLEAKSTVSNVLKDLKKQQENFTYQRQKIIAEIEKRQKKHVNNDYELLEKDQRKREQLFFREQGLNEVKEQYELICKELDKWEYTNALFQEELRSWATEFKYPLDLEAEYYDKLLKMMEEIKKKQRQLSFLKQKLVTLENEIEQFENQVEDLCLELGVAFYRKI
ncbi:MAG: AAA family ATPase [Anaerobacillus sp.]|uniref:AAA family ATPase n=1 Tax=Anaerobacillus sp. TaxID=1872506 RepID=UPI00391D5B60